jgi:hypothetical protein
MKKTMKGCGMKTNAGSTKAPDVRKGNKPISKAMADNRTAKASGGLCSTDWMISQKKQ